jgi:hypothetical protein
VTSTILGPRTLGQLQAVLAGLEVSLSDEQLDQIDQIVPPGTNLTRDGLWRPPALTGPLLRRRPPRDRPAA